MIETAMFLLAAGAVQAPQPAAPTVIVPIANDHERKPTSRWFVRAGVARAHYNPGARITTKGKFIPGSTVAIPGSTTLIVDVGYDLSDDVSVMFMGGFPPSVNVIGKGSVSPFGKLGQVQVGPAVLTAVYHLPDRHGFRPYVGAGVAHLFILKTKDGSVRNLKVHDHNGFALQAGVEYRLSRKWELFADYKRIWLNVRATGVLAGDPVRARITMNPKIVSTGIKFRFE